MRRTLLVIATYSVLLLPGVFQQSAFGQNSLSVPTPDTAIGNSPLASYDVSEIDAVNPVNGNLFLQLPLLSYPQRGKSLRLSFKIYYNDKAWDIKYSPGTPSNSYNVLGVGQWQMPVVQGVTVSRDQNLTFWTNTSNFGANLSNGTGGQNVNTAYYSEFVTSPDGSQHYYSDSAQQTCSTYGSGITCPAVIGNNSPTTNVYPATDGSGYTPVPAGTPGGFNIADTAGSVYSPGLITDIDGNTIETTATGWTDSVGRIIPGAATNPGLPYPTPLAGWGYAEDLVPGIETAPASTPCPTGSKDARLWTVPAPENAFASYYLCYNDFSYFSNFNLDTIFGNTLYQNVYESGAKTARLLTAIILPNLTSYSFSYDNYLSLTQLTLPSGGSIAYTWQTVPFLVPYPTAPEGINWPSSPVSRALSTRTVSPGNGEAPQVWSYHWYLNTANSGTVNYAQPSWSVVTDPYGHDTEHQLGGTDANGNVPATLVETATTVYSGCSPHDTAPNRTCSTSSFALMQSKAYGLTALVSGGAQLYSPSQVAAYFPSWKPTTTVTTIPSAAGSLVTKTVIAPEQNHGTCTVSSLGILQAGQATTPAATTTTYSSCFGYYQEQSVATYDYGVGASGSLHSTVNTTYAWNSGTSSAASYLAANLLDLVSKKTTTNPAGTVASETDFTYDESSYSPAGLHGDLTSLTKVNQQGASPALHGFYNGNGEITKALDGNGGPTSVTAFQCGGSLPQTITNALGQTSQYTFDCGTGVLTEYQDANDIANGRPGSKYSYDAIRNPILVTRPDGGSTTISYNSYALPLTVTKTVLASPDPSVVSSTVYDGFLKPVQSVLPNGATVETTYDLLGRKQTVTNPHFASVPASTDGTTTMLYDSLGRTIQTLHPDGASLWNCFNGLGIVQQPNCYNVPTGGIVGTWVDNADESGNDWQKLSDAEGELRQVVEPGALLTSYTYDVLGNLQSVNQSGASGQTPRNRTFNYDSLSRLLCASNPENSTAACPAVATGSYIVGTIGYSYDTNSNLKSKTDARNITSSYTYDGLNRLYAKSYFNSSGQSSGDPSVYIQYDRPATGGSDANAIGRMTLEWTGPPSTVPSSSTSDTAVPAGAYTGTTVLSHDSMGRVTSEQQCPLYPCSTVYPFSYMYDLAGSSTQWNNGMAGPGTPVSPGLVWTASYDAASRINELQTSTQPWAPSTTYPSELINLGLTGAAPSYDSFDHIVNEQASIYPTSAGVPGLEMLNAYDDRGRITSEQVLGHAAPSTAATNSFGVIAVTGAEQAVGGSFIGTGTVTIGGSGVVSMSVSSAPSCTGTFVANSNGSNPPTTGECYTTGSGAFVLIKISTAPGSQGQMLATTQCPFTISMASSNYNIASGIASCINSSGYAGVNAVANSAGVTVTQTAANPSSYIYTLGGGITTSKPTTLTYSASGLSYTPLGGPDTGTVNVAITNGPTKVTTTSSVTWGGSSTPAILATALSSAINTAQAQAPGGAFVKASVDQNGYVVDLQSTVAGSSDNYPVVVNVSDTSNPLLPPSFQFDSSSTAGGANASSGGYAPIYSYTVPAGGYALNSNLMAHSDSVMGDWAFQYDTLNRLTAAAPAANAPASLQNMIGCYGYDSFGNRTLAGVTATDCSSTGAATATYNAKNQVTWTSVNAASVGFVYDSSGNVVNDGKNEYLYDAEGRLCAVNANYSVAPSFTQYVYNAEGARVAKGNLTSWPASCGAPGANGFAVNAQYLIAPGGDQVTELNTSTGKMAWAHSNVWAGAHLDATYDPKGLHFHLADPLGTRRVQANALGAVEETCQSLFFGEQLTCVQTALSTASDATEHHFTGKERDAESGLDYFGARYYASNMGRFMSPDWAAKAEPVPYAKLDNPQSLNLYAYVGNNPLSRADLDGHCYQGPDGQANCGINCICQQSVPTDAAGKPLPPPVAPPRGNNGEANSWRQVKGSGGKRGVKWESVFPTGRTPEGKGTRATGSWDPGDASQGIPGHYDTDTGMGGKNGAGARAWLPDGTQIDHWGNPVNDKAGFPGAKPMPFSGLGDALTSLGGFIWDNRAPIIVIGVVAAAVALAPETGGASLGLLATVP